MEDKSLETKVTRIRLSGHTSTIKCLDWNSTGKLLASCSSDRNVIIWNSEKKYKKEYTFPFSNHISQVKWSPVTPTLIACTYDKEVVVIWSIDNEDSKSTIRLSGAGYTDFLSWSPDGKFLAVENDRGTVYIIDIASKEYTELKNDENASAVRNEICWGMDSGCLFIASKGGIIHDKIVKYIEGNGRIDMIAYNEELKAFQNAGYMNCHMGECTTIDIDRKHANLATGSTDTYVNYLDCNEMICLNAIKCQKTGIRCVRWTAEGKYIAICGEDGNIMVASVTSGDIKACFTIDKDCHVFANHPKNSITAVVGNGSKRSMTEIEIVTWK